MKQTGMIGNGRVITPSKTIENGVVVFEDGKITAVDQKNRLRVPKSVKMIDASGKIVAPGFIDIHVHGGKGRDVMDASYEAIKGIAQFLVSHGTTSFVPTTISAPRFELLEAVKAVKAAMKKGTGGAEVLGAHLEGPYINIEKRGAHDANFVRLPSVDELWDLLEASNRALKIVTLAPELEGSKVLIEKLRVRSIGFNRSLKRYLHPDGGCNKARRQACHSHA